MKKRQNVLRNWSTPSSGWGDCCRPPPQRIRLPDQLRIANRIDVEFLGPFNLHLVAKDAVNDRSCWMISDFRAIPVIGVCLFPYSAVFQTNHGSAGQSVEGAVHATDKQIHLGALDLRGTRGSFLFGYLSIALQPGIELLQLLLRELVQTGGLEFFRGHHLLNAAGYFLVGCTSGLGTGEKYTNSKHDGWEYT